MLVLVLSRKYFKMSMKYYIPIYFDRNIARRLVEHKNVGTLVLAKIDNTGIRTCTKQLKSLPVNHSGTQYYLNKSNVDTIIL